MKKTTYMIFVFLLTIALAIPMPVNNVTAATPITFTILHTNDFHGNLELAGSNPGAARVAKVIKDVRTAVGANNVLLMDGGDIMQGSLLSNLQKGLPTIDYYKQIGYQVATFGNHEFDWGQKVLSQRTLQAANDSLPGTAFPFVAANITAKVGGSCDGWEKAVLVGENPADTYTIEPYTIIEMNTTEGPVKVGVMGLGSIETPYITIAEATDGLCFKDPATSILHYYDDMIADGVDVTVILSHNGWVDGGYGYGFTVYGDQTLAAKLNAAGKPVNLIIGAHSHTNIPAPAVVGSTTVVQAHYAGRQVGRADITFDPDTKAVSITWNKLLVSPSGDEDPDIKALIASYVNDPDYQDLINEPIGYIQTDLMRNYDGDGMMGTFIQDAVYYQLNTDNIDENDVDFVFNNPGGLRIDWCDKEDPENPGTYIWSSDATDCSTGLWSHDPMLLTFGKMFQILPFGNATVVGEMTGAQVIDLLNQSATLFKGALSVAGIRHQFYRYSDALPGPQPWAWGAYDIVYFDKLENKWKAIDPNATYKIATNEFLAPAGQDGFVQFKYAKNISYWGDMLDLVNEWVANNHSDPDTAYKGPNGDGTLDGRVTRNGNNTGGDVIPLTILHHNDSHGRLLKSGANQGLTQLATLIKQERDHNPNRTLLLHAGDFIQGDSMMYYFKSAGLGYAADKTLLPPQLQINPTIKALNAIGYDAVTLGNHEFNFGAEVFSTLEDANFPILQANIKDDGSYGLSNIPVLPYITKTVGPEILRVAILGIGNHRIPSYELPSNIPGLTFLDPIATAASYAPQLKANNDVVIALTHIGFTTDPNSIEVDDNVDTFLAQSVNDIDVIIGGHSHTRPDTGFGDYKFLPTILGSPDSTPVLVTQANRYNTFLGEVVVGLLPKQAARGAYEVVSQAGRYISVPIDMVEDPAIKAIVDPYATLLASYNNTEIGETEVPIDALSAYTQETNGANLQADAAVWKLKEEGIDVDFHLSGAMTNSKIANTATELNPYTLKVADMFVAMPYENSLVVMEMNGPQLKAVLERAYRNYYYYKYVPGYGGYSYYTTCMLDTNADNNITYWDKYPELPDGNNVLALTIDGVNIDFNDASTYYRVSSVNYLAAGACNFSDGGHTLWPLEQIVADTQYYVRDAVIEYVTDLTTTTGEPIHPLIEGRLIFNTNIFKTFMPVINR